MAISFEALAVAPKSQEAGIMKVNQQVKEENQQPMIADKVHEQTEQKLERTTAFEQKGNSDNNKDAKDKGSNEYVRMQMEKKKKEQEMQKSEDLKKMLGCSFTVSI